MKRNILLAVFLLVCGIATSQDDGRQLLRGKVLYRNVNVPNENVLNIATEAGTITNENGEFSIRVKEGDDLAFTSLNYQLEVVKVTAEILQKNRLVVEVDEKVTQLDEVVVSPENEEKFIKVQNEEFQKHTYELDRSTKVVNIAESQQTRGMQYGLNFVNLFKALVNSGKNKDKDTKAPLKLSQVLRQVYDDRFFVSDLKIPQDKINEFLYYCDNQMPAQSLLKKDNEFQLIDFLVTQSKSYLNQLNSEK